MCVCPYISLFKDTYKIAGGIEKMANVYDIAHELSAALKETEEFNSVRKLYVEVKQDNTAKDILENFRNIQLELQQKQMENIQISEEEIAEAHRLFELAQENEKLSQLLEAEKKIGEMIQEINRTMTKPLEDLYNALEEKN